MLPELDLNNLSITATPTNPDSPNGETIVEFTFRVKDDISGYKNFGLKRFSSLNAKKEP